MLLICSCWEESTDTVAERVDHLCWVVRRETSNGLSRNLIDDQLNTGHSEWSVTRVVTSINGGCIDKTSHQLVTPKCFCWRNHGQSEGEEFTLKDPKCLSSLVPSVLFFLSQKKKKMHLPLIPPDFSEDVGTQVHIHLCTTFCKGHFKTPVKSVAVPRLPIRSHASLLMIVLSHRLTLIVT